MTSLPSAVVVGFVRRHVVDRFGWLVFGLSNDIGIRIIVGVTVSVVRAQMMLMMIRKVDAVPESIWLESKSS